MHSVEEGREAARARGRRLKEEREKEALEAYVQACKEKRAYERRKMVFNVLKAIGKFILAWLACCVCFWLLVIIAPAATPEEAEQLRREQYAAVFSTADDADFQALEQVVYWEAGHVLPENQGFEMRCAVVETVINRCLDPAFPSGIYEVCHQRGQFVCRPIKGATDLELEQVSDAIAETMLAGPAVLPDSTYQFFATKKQRIAKDHILIGNRSRKGQFTFFGRKK